jgi:hypothetical protein
MLSVALCDSLGPNGMSLYLQSKCSPSGDERRSGSATLASQKRPITIANDTIHQNRFITAVQHRS